MTIDKFNTLTGQKTLHPLVGIADLTEDRLESDIVTPCKSYALLCNDNRLRLIIPGETFRIPAAKNLNVGGYTGIMKRNGFGLAIAKSVCYVHFRNIEYDLVIGNHFYKSDISEMSHEFKHYFILF